LLSIKRRKKKEETGQRLSDLWFEDQIACQAGILKPSHAHLYTCFSSDKKKKEINLDIRILLKKSNWRSNTNP
jgi:hypothetical protein